MSRKFIIAVDRLSEEEEKKILEYMKVNESQYNWWHYIENFWLLVDYRNVLTAEILRDVIKNMVSTDKNIFVMEVPARFVWAARGPAFVLNNMFTWLHNIWSK